MSLLNKSLGSYVSEARIGLLVLLAIGFLRFLMGPVFGIPYARGTNWTSMTIVLLILMIIYSIKVAGEKRGFKDLLGLAIVFGFGCALMIIVGILASSLFGIQSYFVDPEHGGSLSVGFHVLGHVIEGVVFAVVLWLIGSLVFMLAGGLKKEKQAQEG